MFSLFGISAAAGVAGLIFGVALFKDLQVILKETNNCIVNDESNAIVQLCDFVDLHSSVIQLSDVLANSQVAIFGNQNQNLLF